MAYHIPLQSCRCFRAVGGSLQSWALKMRLRDSKALSVESDDEL